MPRLVEWVIRPLGKCYDSLFIQMRHCPAVNDSRVVVEDVVPRPELGRLMRESRIVVTHAGPTTVLEALEQGKVPIIVPRLRQFREHVDDHQLKFARLLNVQCGLPVAVDERSFQEALLRPCNTVVGEWRATGVLAVAEMARTILNA